MKKYLLIILILVNYFTVVNVHAQIINSNNKNKLNLDLTRPDLIKNSQTIKNPKIPLEGAIDPSTYILGPGDELMVNITGKTLQETISVIIFPQGIGNIPTIGNINFKDLTIIEAEKIITEKLSVLYVESIVSVSLTNLRAFKVYVNGAVHKQGLYYANFTTRVSDIIQEAKGITRNSDGSSIEIRRLNGEVKIFNHWDSILKGDNSTNFTLQDGDIIFVPHKSFTNGSVMVQGLSNAEGYYDFYPGETVKDLIYRTQLDTLKIDWNNLILNRTSENGSISIIKLSITGNGNPENSYQNMHLKNGDVLNIPMIQRFVFIQGEINRPGMLLWNANKNANYYISIAGRRTNSEKTEKIKITRGDLNLELLGGSTLILPGDVIFVPKKRLSRFKEIFDFASPIISIVIAMKAVGIIN